MTTQSVHSNSILKSDSIKFRFLPDIKLNNVCGCVCIERKSKRSVSGTGKCSGYATRAVSVSIKIAKCQVYYITLSNYSKSCEICPRLSAAASLSGYCCLPGPVQHRLCERPVCHCTLKHFLPDMWFLFWIQNSRLT